MTHEAPALSVQAAGSQPGKVLQEHVRRGRPEVTGTVRPCLFTD
jgi:hypothetical protein